MLVPLVLLALDAQTPRFALQPYRDALASRIRLRPVEAAVQNHYAGDRSRVFIDGRRTQMNIPNGAALTILRELPGGGFAGVFDGTESGAYTISVSTGFIVRGRKIATVDTAVVGAARDGTLLSVDTDQFPQVEGPASPGRATLWRQGKTTFLGFAEEGCMSPNGIVAGYALRNNKGKYTGMLGNQSIARSAEAFLYRNGRRTVLGNWVPVSVNSSAQVVGFSCPDQEALAGNWNTPQEVVSEVVLWSGGRLQHLGKFGGVSAYPIGIREDGSIVGVRTTKAKPNPSDAQIFIWRNGRITWIPNRIGKKEIDALGDSRVDYLGRIVVEDVDGYKWFVTRKE